MPRYQTIETRYQPPEPERPRPVTEDVAIPGLRALISGAFVALVVLLAVQVFKGLWLAWPAAGLIWAGVALAVWIVTTWDWLAWRAEELTGQDLDADGIIGDPGRYVLVNAAPPEETESPVDRAHKRLCQFVEAAADSTAQRDLEAQGFTRDEIQMFRGLLLRGGYARWRNNGDKRSGWMLTRPPGIILARIK